MKVSSQSEWGSVGLTELSCCQDAVTFLLLKEKTAILTETVVQDTPWKLDSN
jgi:hypothetical protein